MEPITLENIPHYLQTYEQQVQYLESIFQQEDCNALDIINGINMVRIAQRKSQLIDPTIDEIIKFLREFNFKLVIKLD